MKREIVKTIILFGILAFPMCGLAEDYNNYSLQELSSMRGTFQNASEEDRNSFREAWRSKMQTASAEELATTSRGNGNGNGSGQGERKGGGNGSGSCDGSGQGGGRGRAR